MIARTDLASAPEPSQPLQQTSPRISVGIPTYNSERTLRSCLKAILSQDYARDSLDIFIVDAGSNDDTIEIARESNVEVLSEPGCTRGRARNICVQRAKAELIAIIDSDVVIPQGWLSTVEGYFKEPSVCEVTSPYYTPEPPSAGLVKKVIYYLTSGWHSHVRDIP